MTTSNTPKRKRRPVLYTRVMRVLDAETRQPMAALVPAGEADRAILRERGLKIGQLCRTDVFRPRNSEFHRLAHRLGTLISQSIEGYEGLDGHQALKRLQERSGHGCDVSVIDIPGGGVFEHRMPRSIAFDEMDQAEFYRLMRNLCTFIAATYWPQCTAEDIERMVDLMPLEGAA